MSPIVKQNLSNTPETNPTTHSDLEWSRDSGWSNIFIKEGLRENLLAEIPGLQVGYDRIRLSKLGNGPVHRLEATSGTSNDGSDQIVDTHELLGEDLTQSVLINPVLLDHLSAGIIAAVSQIAEKYQRGEYGDDGSGLTAYSSAASDVSTVSSNNSHAFVLFDDLIQQKDSFLNSRFVYRRTRTVNRGNSLALAYANVNKVFSAAQLINDENIPSPESSDISNIGGEWLKRAPQRINAFGQKTQISYEYVWATVWQRSYYEAKS